MQIQITQAMLDNMVANSEVKRDAFNWAAGLYERRSNQHDELQGKLWLSVNNALGIRTDGADSAADTVGVSPMLGGVEFESTELNAPMAKALVSLQLDTNGQVLDLGWLDNPDAVEAKPRPEGLDDPNVVRIKAANLRVAAMSDTSGKFVALIHNDPREPLESIPTTGTAHAARNWATVNAIIDDMRQCATMLWGPNRTTGKPNPRAKNMN